MAISKAAECKVGMGKVGMGKMGTGKAACSKVADIHRVTTVDSLVAIRSRADIRRIFLNVPHARSAFISSPRLMPIGPGTTCSGHVQ